METMMTINETAKHYGVSVNTIYRRLQSGLLMGNKVGNKWWINAGSPNDTTDGNDANGGALVDQMQARIDSLEAQLTTRAGEIDSYTGYWRRPPLIQPQAAHGGNSGVRRGL